MSRQVRSRVRWFAAGFATASLLAAAVASCQGGDQARPSEPSSSLGAAQAGESTRAAPALARRPPRTPPVDPPETVLASDAPESMSRAPDDVGDDDVFPWIDVEVVESDGRPCPQGRVVYALEAGVRPPGDMDPPNVATDEAGRCRLHVLRPGRYDVGVVSFSFHALATDVDIPSARGVRMVFPECVRLDMTVEQPLFPEGVSWTGATVDVRSDSAQAATWPGRGEVPRFGIQLALRQPARVLTCEVARGTACRLDIRHPEFSAIPETFTVPASVRIVRDRVYGVRPQLAFEPRTPPFSHPAQVRLEVSAGAGPDDVRTWTACLGSDTRLQDPAPGGALDLHVRTPSGTIRWSGEGFLPGSADYEDLVADETREVRLDVRFARDAPYPPREPDAAVHRTLARTIRVGSRPPGAGVPKTYLCDPEGNWIQADADAAERVEVQDAGFALALAGEFVAGPVDVGSAEEGELQIDLARGGRLVVVPLCPMPPPSLGVVTLSRKDGLPFFATADRGPVVSVDLEPGLVVGPLPPGDVEFVVRVAGEEIASARATVRAGVYELLRIPRFAPR